MSLNNNNFQNVKSHQIQKYIMSENECVYKAVSENKYTTIIQALLSHSIQIPNKIELLAEKSKLTYKLISTNSLSKKVFFYPISIKS